MPSNAPGSTPCDNLPTPAHHDPAQQFRISEGDELLAALADYGAAVGKAFQIADDVLNATADEAALGKPVGSDAARHKATYVALYGVDRSRAMAAELTDRALAALAPFGDAAGPLRLLCQYAVGRKR